MSGNSNGAGALLGFAAGAGGVASALGFSAGAKAMGHVTRGNGGLRRPKGTCSAWTAISAASDEPPEKRIA
jgi:hypothetical protein